MDEGAGQMEGEFGKVVQLPRPKTVTREQCRYTVAWAMPKKWQSVAIFVDARVLSIFEGAEEVLALKVIARELIENAKEI